MSLFSVIPYTRRYASDVSHIYHDAIGSIDAEFYPLSQCQAWSASPRSGYHWHKRLTRSKAWVLVDDSDSIDGKRKCCGFINIETGFNSRGYIDSLYIAPDVQGQGLAHTLYNELELWALTQGFTELSVDASRLSKGLFLAHGFKLQHRSYQEKKGQVIMGFLMVKNLT